MHKYATIIELMQPLWQFKFKHSKHRLFLLSKDVESIFNLLGAPQYYNQKAASYHPYHQGTHSSQLGRTLFLAAIDAIGTVS